MKAVAYLILSSSTDGILMERQISSFMPPLQCQHQLTQNPHWFKFFWGTQLSM